MADEAAAHEAVCPDCGAAIGAAVNPFQSPAAYLDETAPAADTAFARRFAEHSVAEPATWLIVTGAVGLAIRVGAAVQNFLQPSPFGWDNMMGVELGGLGLRVGPEIALAVFGLETVLCLVVIHGGRKMKRLDHYWFGVAAAIVVMIPGLSPCCMLGAPFGVWSLRVLADRRVRAAFRR